MTDQIAVCQQVLDRAHAAIQGTSAAALSNQTPCAEWDARALIDHMIGVVTNFGKAFGGAPMTPPTPGQGAAGAAGGDLAGTYRQAADALLGALRAPGALEKSLTLPFGEMPGGQAIGIVIGDQSIHTWDLSKATGQSFAMDEGVASAVLGALHQLLTPERRGPGKAFAEEVACPADASAQDRLLAFSGRQP